MSPSRSDNGHVPTAHSSPDELRSQLTLFWTQALDRLKEYLEGQDRAESDTRDSAPGGTRHDERFSPEPD
jgi:hypothetical protein